MAEQDTAAPVAAPVVFDPPHIYLHKDSRVPPLPVYTQAQADALPPEWMSPDVWNAGGGGGGGGGGAQSPWTGDVDAAGHALNNVERVYLAGGGIWDFEVQAAGNMYLKPGQGAALFLGDGGPFVLRIDSGLVKFYTAPPQYADLAAAQAALGVGSGTV